MDRLKYISTERMWEGVIVALDSASVTIDIKGRLGQLKVPLRMLISKENPQIGHEVGFMMSYPEVLDPTPNEHYVNALNESEKKRLEVLKEKEKL